MQKGAETVDSDRGCVEDIHFNIGEFDRHNRPAKNNNRQVLDIAEEIEFVVEGYGIR